MDLALAILDNFLQPETAVMLRRFATRQEYGVQEHDGIPYHGVALDPGLISPEQLGRAIGRPVKIKASFFRLGPPIEQQNSYIHVDNGMYGSLAAVLYLCDPPGPGGYGTAFWTHKERGWAYLPNYESLVLERILPPPLSAELQQGPGQERFERRTKEFYAALNEDGLHEDRWALNGLAGMRFNRLVVYPTCLFHSRFPRALTGFGDTPEDGRLIWGCFFDPA